MKTLFKHLAVAIPVTLVAVMPAQAISLLTIRQKSELILHGLEKKGQETFVRSRIHLSAVSPQDVLEFMLSGMWGKDRICDTLSHFEEMVAANKGLDPEERKFLDELIEEEKRRFVCNNLSPKQGG